VGLFIAHKVWNFLGFAKGQNKNKNKNKNSRLTLSLRDHGF